jgi:hypothetical protein
MRITTERRLERLEAADGQEGVVYVVLDTLPEADVGAGRLLTEEEWQAKCCGPDYSQ